MTSEEIASDDKIDLDVTAMSTESNLPEQEALLPVAKPLPNTTTMNKPAAVRPAPAAFAGTKGRSETTKLGRKGKRKFDSAQGTSATKKSKG